MRGRGEGRVRREENSPSAEAVARCWPVESNAMSRISSSCPLWRGMRTSVKYVPLLLSKSA